MTRGRRCILALLLVWSAGTMLLLAGMGAAHAGQYGGPPAAVWQDNDRSHRNNGVGHLPPSATDARAARARVQAATPGRTPGQSLNMQTADDWRLRIRDAATTQGDMVTLGDIADPLGAIPTEVWRSLAAQQLWPAPPDPGKPLQINRARLSQALRQVLGSTADRCLLPTSLAVQRGGAVLREDELRSLVVKTLTPQLALLPGKAELNDFRLPAYIFLAHPQQQVTLEPGKIVPGRVPLRFVVQETDGTVLKRVAGTVSLDLWVEVPAAARPLNKGDALTPDAVTFIRMNVAQLRNMPWDGRGGPWQVLRSIGSGQPIFQGDLASQSMVRKGGIVTLLYESGNIRMTVQAEALADGEPGATIPVRNLQSKKQVFASVRDGNTVVAR